MTTTISRKSHGTGSLCPNTAETACGCNFAGKDLPVDPIPVEKYHLLLAVLCAAVVLALAFLFFSETAPRLARGTETAKPPGKASAPSMPFDPATLKPGEKVSASSIERLETRVTELRESRKQLAVKMRSIDDRIADPAQAANAAALREAKRALQKSTEKMEMEEKALIEFLRNEQKTPPTGA